MNTDRILTLLQSLYGPAVAAEVSLEIATRIRAHRHHTTNTLELTQRDALVICYADHVQHAGERPLQSLAQFAQQHLSGTVSGIHLLPFYPWTSDDGFSVKDFFRVDPAFGTWDDIAEFTGSFDLMFDAVFNHMSAQSEWFQKFLAGDPAYADFFVTVEGNPDLSQVVRPRALPLLTEFHSATGPRHVWTTFSADQVDVNVQNPRVLLALLEALLFYTTHGARFIRLDAIAFLWKEIGTRCQHLPQTHAVIQLMRAVLDEAAPHVQLITETNVPHTDNISYFGDGTNEAQLVYNFALPPLVLHAFASGDATALTRWAATLQTPSDRTAFFNFLASHDGIGVNPARGILSETEINALVERVQRHGGHVSLKNNPDGTRSPYELNITWFDAINPPDDSVPEEVKLRRYLSTQSILLSLAGMPGIYLPSLVGARNDRTGAEISGIPRRINREKFMRPELDRQLATPHSHAARIFTGYQTLLRLRRQHPAFHPQAAQTIPALDPRVFAVLRETANGSDRVLCLHNVSAEPVTLPLPWPAKDAVNGQPIGSQLPLAAGDYRWLRPAK